MSQAVPVAHDPEQLLTKAQAAAEAQVSVRTITNWMAWGWLEYKRMGGVVRIKRRWLEDVGDHRREAD